MGRRPRWPGSCWIHCLLRVSRLSRPAGAGFELRGRYPHRHRGWAPRAPSARRWAARCIDKLDLDKAGIAHDRGQGDDRLRSVTNKRVFAIGDAAGGPRFPRRASRGVVRSVLGWAAKASRDHLPYATFTDQEWPSGPDRSPGAEKIWKAPRWCAPGSTIWIAGRTARHGLVKVMVIKSALSGHQLSARKRRTDHVVMAVYGDENVGHFRYGFALSDADGC